MKWIKLYEEFRPSGGVLPAREINEEELKQFVRKNCGDFLEILKSADYDLFAAKESFLFRKSVDIGDMIYSNPGSAGHERIAPYSPTGNYHNLVLSNLESWKEYPKRNKSICTSKFSRISIARGKETYLVIPYDTTKIGIAPSVDMWWAFKSITKVLYPEQKYENPGLLIEWFRSVMEVVEKHEGKKVSDVSWQELKSSLDKMYPEFSKAKYQSPSVHRKNKQTNAYFPGYDKRLTLLQNLEVVLDPSKHGFSIGYMRDIPSIFSQSSVECWFQEDCLMVKWDLLKDKGKEEIRSIFE